MAITPISSLSLSIGTATTVRAPASIPICEVLKPGSGSKLARFGLHVRDLNRPFRRGCACERDARTGAEHRIAAAHFSKRRWCIVHRDDAEKAFPFTEVHGAELGFADTHRVRQHGLKNRLELTRRSADDAEDLGCRGLLLQRLA